MFGRSKHQAVSTPTLRDTLFGDLPLAQWPPAENGDASASEPWRSFVAARDAVAGGRMEEAIGHWRRIVATAGLESRHSLQAWHFLRAHGVGPSAVEGKRLLGVVIEVPMEGGLDLLAAYPEHTARYYNYSGAGVVWERPDATFDAAIDALLRAGQRILDAIGPWHEARPSAPPAGQVRLNFLSPAGLHFGQAPFATFLNDGLAKPVIDAGTALMQQLVEHSQQQRAAARG